MSDRLRFGLIGCGSQGRFLSEALRMTGRGVLAACADPNQQAAQTAVDQCGYEKAYSSAEDMLQAESPDAVIVATIHDQLQPMALAAVQAGAHAFVEKPMALNAGDGQELVDAARTAQVRLMVGYTLRFMPERLLMKQLIEQGAVGSICHVNCGQCIGFSGDHWLTDPAHGGGPLFYIGSHALDNALWMAADHSPQQVHAIVHRPDAQKAEASVDALITCDGDVVIHLCTSYRIGGRYGWLDVVGSAGRMRSEWESNVLYVYSDTVEAYRQPTEIAVPPHPSLPPVLSDAVGSVIAAKYLPVWAAEMHEFADAITEGRDPCVSGADGVTFLRVADAIFTSARSGAPVQL